MIVMKFGGSSVGDAERIRSVAQIVKSKMNQKPVVVVSAVKGITDMLIKLANEKENREKTSENIKNVHYGILNELNIDKLLIENDLNELMDLTKDASNADAKLLDRFVSFGERMSSKIVAAELRRIGIKSEAFNSYDIGFLTDDNFGDAEPLKKAYDIMNEKIKKMSIVPVITGFLGKTENNEITTLGRGGSDFTAGIIGAAINAAEIQIWTDVDGIMTTDPRIANSAKTISEVSFAEASELAYFGAKVLHPKSILPAMKKNIPVKVLNTFNPDHPGTTIVNKAKSDKSNAVKAIACKKNITLVNINSTRMIGSYGFMAKLFGIFADWKKSIDVISTSEVSVSLSMDNDRDIGGIVLDLRKISNVDILRDKSIICVVGEGMRHTPGVSGRIFSALGCNKINIEMISQGASEINVTFIVDGKDADNAVRVLHKEYFGG